MEVEPAIVYEKLLAEVSREQPVEAREEWAPNAEQEEEVRQVREERMAQLQLRRQMEAMLESPPVSLALPLPVQQQRQARHNVAALTELLVILDTIAAVDEQQQRAEEDEVSPCAMMMAEAQAKAEAEEAGVEEVATARPQHDMSEFEAVTEVVVEEEVVLLVDSDRSGHTVVMELHRLIYHADSSPCSHFRKRQPDADEQQPQQDDMRSMRSLASERTAAESVAPSESRMWSSMPAVEQVVLAVLLVSGVLLLLTTVAVACVVRQKRRQQRVLLEAPTIEQLGLDVPMLSSSPSATYTLPQL